MSRTLKSILKRKLMRSKKKFNFAMKPKRKISWHQELVEEVVPIVNDTYPYRDPEPISKPIPIIKDFYKPSDYYSFPTPSRQTSPKHKKLPLFPPPKAKKN